MSEIDQLAHEIAGLRQQLAQSSRSLREAEARLDAVFNSSLSLLSICTIDGMILDVNDAALRAVGSPIETFVGKHVWETPWFAKNPAEAAKIELELTIHRGQYVEYDSVIVSASGDRRRYQFVLRPYRSYIGDTARFLIFEVRDVTGVAAAPSSRAALPAAQLGPPVS